MSADLTTSKDHALLEAGVPDHDPIQWRAHARVEKWDQDATRWVRNKTGLTSPVAADFKRLKVTPYEEIDAPGNLLTTAGLTRITSLIVGGGGQAATNTSARTGVGDSTSSAAVGDTDLLAASGNTHRWFQIMDTSYPSASAAVITFKSTFASADGNFAWNEWGIDIGTPTVTSGSTVNAVLLNHKASAALGTKASGSSWALTTTITLS